MRDASPQVTYLKDYTPPAFRIASVALDVHVEPGEARVHARLGGAGRETGEEARI